MLKRFLIILTFFITIESFGQDKFHFIFIGKTADLDLNKAISADAKLADSLFTYIEREADIVNMVPHFFTGKEYSSEHIRTFIDTLQLSKSDKVFMIIDNHGARFDGQYSRFPMVQLPYTEDRGNGIFDYYSLKGMHDSFVAKGAGFVFTLGIMCNSYLPVPPGSTKYRRIRNLLNADNPTKRLIRNQYTYRTKYDSLPSLLKLFQLSKGQILMNSGDRMQPTYYKDSKGTNNNGSLALQAVFDEFINLKDVINADGPVEIGSNLLNDIRSNYDATVEVFRRERRKDQNDKPIQASNFIYKASINGVTFDHADPVVKDTSPPPPPCDKKNIVAKSQSLIVDLLRDMQIRYQGSTFYENDFYAKFRNNANGISIGLVKGLKNPTAMEVPVRKYYKDYIVKNKGYKKVQVSLKDSAAIRVYGPYLINSFSQSDPDIDRYELRVEFTQVFVGLTDKDCIAYKDETWKTAVVYVFMNKNSCFIEDAYIVGIYTEDGNIRPLANDTIYAFDPVSQSNKAYTTCSRPVGN
ncbi:MAG: hypothetical protein WBA74_12085 [Cyclobacteriaceae bacterium]